MNTLFNKEVREAMVHGIVAGVLVLVLNGIGHYVFEAPEVPFAFGVAVLLAALVTAVEWFVHPHGGPRTGH